MRDAEVLGQLDRIASGLEYADRLGLELRRYGGCVLPPMVNLHSSLLADCDYVSTEAGQGQHSICRGADY